MVELGTIYSLNNWTVTFGILLALISLGTGQEIIRNLEPGHVIIDLGDGYNASLDLANSEKSYDIEIKEPGYGDLLLKTRSYGFIIYNSADNEELAELTLDLYSTPSKKLAPQASREDRKLGPLGIRAISPRIIDNATGLVGIDWPKKNAAINATNISDAVDAFFYYYPGAKTTPDGIETYIEVSGQTGAFDRPLALTLFQSLLDSIHISRLTKP